VTLSGVTFSKELHSQDKDIQIERNRSRYNVCSPPGSTEAADLPRKEGHSQKDERYDAYSNRRREAVKRKEEPGDGRKERGRQKDIGWEVETLSP
jgi:hypothetical protein